MDSHYPVPQPSPLRTAPLIQTQGIFKQFPGVKVLNDVNFDLHPGEVHALCGENGAGKSTLMRVLAGSLQPDQGTLYLNGTATVLPSPLIAKRRGILLIHQEISLVPNLTVAENLFLGDLPMRAFGHVDFARLHRDTAQVLQLCGCDDVSPFDIVGALPIARQQMVEIARASAFRSSIVIFDEPTASLTEHEAESLFSAIERLKKQNVGIVYISHKMKEVFHLADRITVLRDGTVTGTLEKALTTPEEVTSLMIGRSFSRNFVRPTLTGGAELLRLEKLCVSGVLHDISLSIKEGEIVGLYGLVGAGRTELAEVLFGLRKIGSGRILWRGVPQDMSKSRSAVELGVGFVPEDRKKQGLIAEMGCQDNVVLASLKKLAKVGFRQPHREQALFERYREQLKIKVHDPHMPARTLSGGNQQKLVLGKWLAREPKLLILDEPTRGIDVGAKAEVHALVSTLAQSGMAILLISSEMPEIIGLSHRILTLYQGALTGEFDAQTVGEETLIKSIMQAPISKPAYLPVGP